MGSKVLIISQSLAGCQQGKQESCISREEGAGVAVVEGDAWFLTCCASAIPSAAKLDRVPRCTPVAAVGRYALYQHRCFGVVLPLFPRFLEAGKPGRDFAVGISNLADFCQSQE